MTAIICCSLFVCLFFCLPSFLSSFSGPHLTRNGGIWLARPEFRWESFSGSKLYSTNSSHLRRHHSPVDRMRTVLSLVFFIFVYLSSLPLSSFLFQKYMRGISEWLELWTPTKQTLGTWDRYHIRIWRCYMCLPTDSLVKGTGGTTPPQGPQCRKVLVDITGRRVGVSYLYP